MPAYYLIAICLFICVSADADAQVNKNTDEADFKEFMGKFPQLEPGYSITMLAHLKNAQPITNLRWTRQINLGNRKELYAIGMIKDCGDTKTLLVVQQLPNSYVYFFSVLELLNGYVRSITSPTEGTISAYDDTFYNRCSVRIGRDGTTTIITTGSGQMYETKITACED